MLTNINENQVCRRTADLWISLVLHVFVFAGFYFKYIINYNFNSFDLLFVNIYIILYYFLNSITVFYIISSVWHCEIIFAVKPKF